MIQKKHDAWFAIIATVLLASFIPTTKSYAQNATTQDEVRPELFYSLEINSENMLMVPRVNGAPLLTHGRFRPLYFLSDITREIKPGINVIQIDYEPIDMDMQSYTPHDGVRVQVALSRASNFLSLQPRIDESVTLFSGRYDTQTGTMIEIEESVFNEGPITREDGGLLAGDAFLLEPVSITYTNRNSLENAMRLTLKFDVSDIAMTTPPWVGADVLTDTPELRDDLYQAYLRVHSALASGNPELFSQAAEPMLTHNARVLGYGSAVEMVSLLNDRQPFAGDENRQLIPMMPSMTATTAPLEFSSDGRLVQFLSAPLAYQNAEGQVAGRLYYYFCRAGGAALAPCFAQDFR